MGRKSKFILGLESKRDSTILIKKFTDEEKRFIIEDYISSGKTKKEIGFKYTGYREEHGGLLRWMRELGYDSGCTTKKSNLAANLKAMQKNNPNDDQQESFENLQLKKRIEELEKQLRDAEMKAIAFSTMVDIAEKEFNIPIRKKSNTKPLKK